MFGFDNLPKRKTYRGYAAATRYRPEWTVGFLVFKGGVNSTKAASITGGGQIFGHYYAYAPQILVSNAPGVYSITGGGQIPGQPPMLVPLLGGSQGQGS